MSDQVQQIAMRIHDLRDVSNYTVEQVAKNTGVSEEEYLSYESGAVDIPISFLLKLSQFYDIDTTTILTGEAPRLSVCAVTRKDMGVSIDRAEHYINKNMETNSHPGHEFDYVLEGSLRLKVGDHETVLGPGDSAYYDSIHPHAMQAVGGVTCKFLAIVIP